MAILYFLIKKITSYLNSRSNLILFVFIIIFFFSVAFIALAHSGGTDSYGCHTCRTNCPSYGLDYGEYHCHQSKGLPQPEYPIRSNDGWIEPWPEYTYPNYSYPSTPDCPLFSSYDSLSNSCKCNYGYIVSGGKCVSGDSYCWDKYGYNSRYDSLSSSCECSYGYVFDSSGQCVSRDNYCQDILGWNAEYKILDDVCGCRSGYVLNSSQTSCVGGDNYCIENFGWNSFYNSLDKSCECENGYELKGSQCVEREIFESATIPQSLPVTPIVPSIPKNNSTLLQKNKVEVLENKKVNTKQTDLKNVIENTEHSIATSSSKELLASVPDNANQEKKSLSKKIFGKVKLLWWKLFKKII